MATMTSLAEEEDFADLQEVAKSVALIHLLPHLALAGCRGAAVVVMAFRLVRPRA